jgi:hypothetical protein
MPKINGKSIDPKAYAARMTQAKKKVASIDPAIKAKLQEFYPVFSNKDIIDNILGTRDNTGLANKIKTIKKLSPKSK